MIEIVFEKETVYYSTINNASIGIKVFEGTYFPYVNGKWTEDKETSLEEAFESVLKYLGISAKERKNYLIKHK